MIRAMNRPYATAVTRARLDIHLAQPRVRLWVLRALRVLSGTYLRLGLGCRSVEVVGMEPLLEQMRAALAGEARLLIAFRHPFVDEPQILGHVVLCRVAREARRRRVRLVRAPHARFVHGYEVPRWGGALERFLLPRVGALPVHHARMDRAGMARIRGAILDGDYPLALAPEGQVSYTSEATPRLELGTMRLALEAADALVSAGRSEPVVVLPISVHRRYRGRAAERSLERLLARIERFVGVPASGVGAEVGARAHALVDRLLERSEAVYGIGGAEGTAGRDDRLQAVVGAAVLAGERRLGIGAGHGGIIERVYRIRQVGWDRIFVSGDVTRLSPMDRAVADRMAGEAWYAMRHMELADFAWYFRTEPPERDAPFHRTAEYMQNLWDWVNRLAGGAISGRVHVRPFESVIIVGDAIEVSTRLEDYRRGRKAAVAAATEDLHREYTACIARWRGLIA